jgi:hypothetical protein
MVLPVRGLPVAAAGSLRRRYGGSARLGTAQVHVWLRILQSTCPLPPAPHVSAWPMDLRVDGGRDNIHGCWNGEMVQR